MATRVQVRDVPCTAMRCPKVCVYAENGTCANPRLHKVNGDAVCHRWGNKKLIQFLKAEEAMATAHAFMAQDVADALEFQRIYELLRGALPGVLSGLDPFWVDWRAWAFGHGLLKGE